CLGCSRETAAWQHRFAALARRSVTRATLRYGEREMKRRLAVGLIGLGRLGRVYARDLASRIAETRLVAVADPVKSLAEEVAAEFDVPRHYTHPLALIDDPSVDAIVIVSPTHTHCDLVVAAAGRRKPTFCEKPPALSLDEVAVMRDAIVRAGILFQMGF